MAKVRVKRFRACCAKKHRSKKPKTFWVLGQQFYSIMRAESFEYMWVMNDLANTENCEHAKPYKHDRPEGATNYFCAEALEYK